MHKERLKYLVIEGRIIESMDFKPDVKAWIEENPDKEYMIIKGYIVKVGDKLIKVILD
jgi:hypothetical protein